jgi:hypothetical protein
MLADKLREHIDAAFSGLWILSVEHDEAISEIRQLANAEAWKVIVEEPNPDYDPISFVRATLALEGEDTTLVVMPNLHQFLDNPVLKQTCIRAIMQGKQTKTFLIVLAPLIKIPVELEKLFVVLEHELPTHAQLETIARQTGTNEGDLPTDEAELHKLIDAAAGLTRFEAEGAFALSIIRDRCIKPDTVWELKAGMLKKAGVLDLYRGTEDFGSIGGLDALKAFCKDVMAPRTDGLVAKGVLLLGVPGTGKSCFAKALGKETSRPTLCLDLGSLMNKHVGETEANLRQALKIADAMAPCILFIDEVEKGLAGTGSDSTGVTTRMFGGLLTWLNDHKTNVFTICTCNNIQGIPPEFSRSGRFDAVYFIDTPTADQREAIWEIYEQVYGIRGDRPECEGWTGAEIKACCYLAALRRRSLVQAATQVVPMTVLAADKVEALRQYAASHGCQDANVEGPYSRNPISTMKGANRRSINRPTTNPSNN